jgi:hypothetical protein
MSLLLASLALASTEQVVDGHLAGQSPTVGEIGAVYHAVEDHLARGYTEAQVVAALAWSRENVSGWRTMPAGAAIDAGLAVSGARPVEAAAPATVAASAPAAVASTNGYAVPEKVGPGPTTAWGVGIGGGTLVHATRTLGLGGGADLIVDAGFTPTIVYDGDFSAGPGAGATVGLFVHGNRRGPRGPNQNGVRFDLGVRWGTDFDYTITSPLIGVSYMKRMFKPDGRRSFSYQIGGGATTTLTDYGETTGTGLVWWNFNWDFHRPRG